MDVRKSEHEKIWLNEATNFHYIERGVQRTPPGTTVDIVECNKGLCTSVGTLKGTLTFGLLNRSGEHTGQMIAWSYDRDDLILFAIDHQWQMDDSMFHDLTKQGSK